MHRCPVCTARDLPRPAPRQRAGPAYGSVLLGDPPSFDEDDTDPHCCVKPLDAVALPSRAATAACRTRHGPAASCSAPMASRLRYLVTVYGPGCLPGHRDYLVRHDSLGFDAGRLLCPLVPREPSEGLARPPTAVSDVHPARNRAHGASGSIRPRRPSTERHGVSVPTRVHPPPQLRHTRVSRHCALAPRRRLPRAMAPRPRRISTGRLVSQSVGMAPDHAATGRHPHGRYNSASTKAAPAKVCYHPCRDCAPGRFSAPSLPDSPLGDRAHETASAASGRRPVVTVRCASDRPPSTNTATARIIVSPARITAMSGRPGPPRLRDSAISRSRPPAHAAACPRRRIRVRHDVTPRRPGPGALRRSADRRAREAPCQA